MGKEIEILTIFTGRTCVLDIIRLVFVKDIPGRICLSLCRVIRSYLIIENARVSAGRSDLENKLFDVATTCLVLMKCDSCLPLIIATFSDT